MSSAVVAASCGGSSVTNRGMDSGTPDASSHEASVEDAPSADAYKDALADDARPDSGDDSGGGEAGADADSGSEDSADSAALVGSFAEFGNGS